MPEAVKKIPLPGGKQLAAPGTVSGCTPIWRRFPGEHLGTPWSPNQRWGLSRIPARLAGSWRLQARLGDGKKGLRAEADLLTAGSYSAEILPRPRGNVLTWA